MATESENTSDRAVEPRSLEAKPRAEVAEPLLKWRAAEYPFYEKGSGWFVAAGVLTLALILGALLLREWLMALVIAALAAVVYQHANRPPRELDYAITNLGIQAGERLYAYNELKSFWVIYQPPVQTLNLALTRRFAPLVTIQLTGADPVQVKELLKKHLPEEEKQHEEWID